MQALAGVREPWRALFVGGGPMADDLTAFANVFPGRVRVLTGVTHDDVPAHLNAMDLMCAPSQTTARWREQFGRMLIEAMACGVPILASRSGEIPHVVGDAGLVVDEADTAVWSAALDRLLADAALRRDLSARGLARAHEKYAWPVVARAHLAFFEELL
jgi:glycosyltransferase involved in cell wall biosynthesis